MALVRPQTAWLAEFNPLDPVTGSRVTVRVGSAPSAAFLGLNSQVWEPAIHRRPVLNQEFFGDDYGGGVLIGRGAIDIAVNALAEAAAAKRMIWRGAEVKIWRGVAADWGSMKLSFEGLVAAERADPDTGVTSLGLEVDTRDGDLLVDSFAGTGGREGAAELKGKLKPAGFGTWAVSPPNIPVTIFDEINVVGQIDAYGNTTAISALFENGSSYGPPIADYASYELLIAAPLAGGQWATCIAEGMIRLGAPPKNGAVLTCDAQFGHDRTGDFIRHLAVNFAGWPPGKIDVAAFNDLDADWDRRIRWWTESQASIFERMAALADAANAHLIVTLTGILTVARRGAGTPDLTLIRGGAGEPFVTKWQELETGEPWYRMQATAGTVYRKHDLDEVDYEHDLVDRGDYEAGETYRAGNIVRYSDGNRYLHIGAEPTSGVAPPAVGTWDLWETGNADLSALVAEFEKLGADGWLVAVEKQGVIERKSDFDEEYDALIARADDLGITTERTAYIDAYDDLETYLATLGPIAWNDTAGTTAIVRATWRTAWNALFEARAVLQDAIENAIKATADAKTRNVPRGAYDDGTTYEAGDQVVFAGSTYQYINGIPSAGNDPPDGAYWILVAAAGSGPTGADGQAGVSNWLTNGNHTVPTMADGSGGDFSDAGGTYKIYRGTTDLTGSATFSVPAKSPNTAWITINSSGVYTVTDPGVDKATATIRAVVGGVNYDITYSLSKNRNGQALRLAASAQAFTFVDGALTPGGQSISLSVVRQNVPSGTAVFTTTPTVTLTGSDDTRVLAAAAFGTSKQVKVKVTIGTIEDEIIIVRLDQSTAEAGATVGAPAGTNINGIPVEQLALGSDTDLYETFSSYNTLAELDRVWNRSGQAQIAFEADATSPGGRRMVLGDNNAVVSDQTQLRCLRSIPYNSEDLYSVEFDEETINPGGLLYFGVAGWNKDGDLVPGNGTFHYVAATAVAPVAGRRKHVGYFRGYGTPVQANDPANPSPLSAGVVRVSAVALVHYVNSGSVAGKTALHSARLRKVEDVTTKWRGTWSAGVTYAYGDGVVSAEGHGFASRRMNNVGNQPPTTFTSNTWWTAVVRKGDTGLPGTPGAPGRDAVVFHQDTTPPSPVVGDTWATVTAPKIWRRWSGSAWVQILGDLAGLNVIADSAYFGDAVILNAHIKNLEVETIKIKENAISGLPGVVGSGSFTTSLMTRASYTFTADLATKYLVFISGLVIIGDAAPAGTYATVRLERNGSVSGALSDTIVSRVKAAEQMFCFPIVMTGLSGSQTLDLRFRASASAGLGDPHLVERAGIHIVALAR